jgi:diguanylate cyclase (GGDEF)-like protein
MKIEKLNLLQLELGKELDGESVNGLVFYYHLDQWNRLDSNPIGESELSRLEKSKTEHVAYHSASDRTAWFFCKDFDGAIALTFSGSPRLAKRKTYRRRIENVLERASNAYQVAHNPLTLLLAKEAFSNRLKKSLASVGQSTSVSVDAQESSQEQILALIAFDIDHFKQVNDTHGHLYGDQVLKAFARRLESVALEIVKAQPEVTVSLGHPSGEEFLSYIEGAFTAEQVVQWAESFRTRIWDKPLPSDDEWAWLSQTIGAEVLVPPITHERKVTASIGIAIQRSASGSVGEDVSALLEKADTALYRAKAGGRNQVVLFDDILTSCGRVLEHDRTSRIVAIDMGKNVGVSIGQEFKVYAENYRGQQKFQITDGRTTRTVGYYPKVELTRITVFDVQPEISFAFPSDMSDHTPIEIGSHLESIPAGSISHTLPNLSRYFPSGTDAAKVGDLAQLKSFVDNMVEAGSHPFAAAFRFAGEQEYLKRYGSIALNAALARLFRTASSTFHSYGGVGISDAASVCVVGKANGYNEDALKDFAKKIQEELPGLRISVGVFSEKDNKKTAGEYQFNPSNAVEFSRFAASEFAAEGDNLITHFTLSTAHRVILALRQAKSYKQALADFDALISWGVTSPRLNNLGGLICGVLGDFDRSISLYEAAIQEQPELIVYRSNFAIACSRMKFYERALVVLNEISDPDLEGLKASHPLGYVNYASLLARAKLEGWQTYQEARFLTMAPQALEISPWGSSADYSNVIRNALS